LNLLLLRHKNKFRRVGLAGQWKIYLDLAVVSLTPQNPYYFNWLVSAMYKGAGHCIFVL
jgi:hypothetical protein